MNELYHKRCVPCEEGGNPLTKEEVAPLLARVSDWKLENDKKISKNFEFKDFREALGFVNEIGDIAEYEGHHPDISLHNWNKVLVSFSTHAVKGLTENDFIMASKVDRTHSEMKE